MKLPALKYVLMALFISGYAHAQIGTLLKSNEERGDLLFKEFSYMEAIEEYKIALKKKPNDELILKIAESYRMLNDPVNSSEWYAKAVEGQVSEPVTYLHYAEALSSLEKYDEAKKWYEKYSTLVTDDERPHEKIKTINNLLLYKDRSIDISVDRAGFNSEASDFSPEFYENNQVVFVSSRSSGKALANIFKWDNSEYLNLYITDNSNHVSLFQDDINTKYHEGPLSIYDNNTKMIFTRDDYVNNSLGADKEGVTKLKLFTSTREANGEWSKPAEFIYNNSEYSVGHPSVTEDGKLLVFVSDMPGGFGGTDLYKSEWINGQWSRPENLGSKINTAGNELFPFVTDDLQLYFSSDGYGGFGGLDLFGIDLASEESSQAVNLGKPFNSSFDDFALIINGDEGYFSSNREGSKNNDDIYSFKAKVPLLQTYALNVSVRDSASKEPVAEATLDLKDASGNSISHATTNDKGEHTFNLNQPDHYMIRVNKPGYQEDSVTVSMEGDTFSFTNTINLKQKNIFTPKSDSTVRNQEVSEPNPIRTIYFDFAKFKLLPEAEKILAEIANIMREDKDTSIEISAYTDSRGDEKFNRQLSEKRFKSAVSYLMSQGIEKSRITGKGYGEEKSLNRCNDGMQCTEEEFRVNRRAELKVTKRKQF